MTTLRTIADNLRMNGKWGRRASRKGWRWLKQERSDLQWYLLDLGCDVSDSLNDAEQCDVWCSMKAQVEWIADHE